MTYRATAYATFCQNCKGNGEVWSNVAMKSELCLACNGTGCIAIHSGIPVERRTQTLRGGVMETVNHPVHYNQGKIEVIDAIEDWKMGFNDGNAIKYIARHRAKGRPQEDLRKALWYIARELQTVHHISKDEMVAMIATVVKEPANGTTTNSTTV